MSAKTPSDPSRAPATAGPGAPGPSGAPRPLWKIVAAIGATVPDAEWRRVPADLGKRVDPYWYGRRPVRDAGRQRSTEVSGLAFNYPICLERVQRQTGCRRVEIHPRHMIVLPGGGSWARTK